MKLLLKEEQKKFLKRNFTAVLVPGLLFALALIVTPFMFITSSLEDLVEVEGHFAKLDVIQGATNDENVFEIKIKQMPGRIFVIEKMRVPDQIGFTADEKVGNKGTFLVERSILEDYSQTKIPVLEFSTEKSKYLYQSVDMAKMMRANRGLSIFFFLTFIGVGVWLCKRLKKKYIKELNSQAPVDFDPYLVWVAQHPLETAAVGFFILYLIMALVLPDGWGGISFGLCVAGYGYVMHKIKYAKNKIGWIQAALENERERIARRPAREVTVAPKHVQAVQLLLQGGGDVNVRNIDGKTALHLAAFGGKLEAVDLLIRSGADLNVLDKDGETPLMAAARATQVGVVAKLIDKGADVLIKNKEGKMAVAILEDNKRNAAVISVLKRATAKAEAAAKAAAEAKIAAEVKAKVDKALAAGAGTQSDAEKMAAKAAVDSLADMLAGKKKG